MTESYKVPFYILGFLVRLGPLHGYQLKLHIEHEASDFAHIKLPNLYYHLGSMKKKGWVVSEVSREGNRPEKEVFSATEEGRLTFRQLLERCFAERIDWDFPADGALFFSKGISAATIVKGLVESRDRVEVVLEHLAQHRDEVLHEVPRTFYDIAALILAHHELHYRTEKEWLNSAIKTFQGRG